MDFTFDLLPVDSDLLTLDMGHLFKGHSNYTRSLINLFHLKDMF